jgi:hypothetical protein
MNSAAQDTRRRKRAITGILNSNGTFDAHAQSALRDLSELQNPNPEDHFQRGRLRQLNMLENTQPRGRDLHAIVRDYTAAVANDQPNPEFVLHQVGDFYYNFDDTEDDPETQRLLFGLGVTLNNHGPQIRQTTTAARAAVAAQEPTQAAAVSRYLDLATHYTDDQQNVHDTKVNKDLNAILRRIKTNDTHCTDNTDATLNDIRKFIRTEYTGSKDRAMRAVDAMCSNPTPILTFGETESNILALTWLRAQHRRNAENSYDIQTAVCNALEDSVEGGNVVCSNGRCGRVLNSLALIDFDPTLTGAMTYEAYRNKIFQETKEIFEREMTIAEQSDDPKIRQIGQSFDDPSIDQDPQALAIIKTGIKHEIDSNIEKYNHILSPAEQSNIKQECYVATEF